MIPIARLTSGLLALLLADSAAGNSPEEFAALIKSGVPKWSKLVRELGIKPE